MKLWLTPQEIADLADAGSLPGLPTTKRRVNAMIEREGWDRHHAQVRTRRDRGGTITEYHIDLLPLAARLAYAGSALAVDPADCVPDTPELDDPCSPGRQVRDARRALVAIADRYARSSDLGTAAADHLFAELYNAGSVAASDWIRETVAAVSPRTLARWRSDFRAGGPAVDPRGSRRGTGVLDRANGGQVRTLILAAIAKNPLLTAKHLRAFVRSQIGDTLTVESRSGARAVPLPPLRTFQASISAWKESYKADLLLLTDPDRYKSIMRPSASGSTRAARLNECWQIDASPADVMTTAGRHSVYVSVDVYSRRMVVLVSDTPKAAAVGLLLRKCLVRWGVPERIKSDNGSDFVANSTRRLIDTLGIEHEACDPYRPEQKGIVERAIGTFQRDLVRTLPGFIGHSVADRKVIENRKAFSKRLGLDEKSLFEVDLTPAELQSYADRWADEIYAHAPHEGLRRRTPFEVANAYTAPVRRIANEDALSLLLAPIAGSDGYRTVTKKGIRVGGEYYWTSAAMPQTRVFCRHDPQDLGRLIVFSEDGETWLGEAIAPELAGVDPAEMHARLLAERKAYHDGRLKDVRRETLAITPRTIVEGQFHARGTADVVAFPRPSDAHTTPAIDAAAAAAGRSSEPTVDPKTVEVRERLKREDAAKPTTARVLPMKPSEKKTARQLFAQARALEARLSAGETLPEAEARWLASYQRTDEYFSLSVTEMDRHASMA
ncbi:DDE-type integrase/transposase/recombinase [Amorphus sp. MBR-141]